MDSRTSSRRPPTRTSTGSSFASSQIRAAVASNLDLLKRILEDKRHIV
jgi:hypothetical protein